MKKSLLLLAVFIAAAFTAFATAPENDNCDHATNLTLAAATPGTTVDAGTSPQAPYFPGMNDDDVWFKFTASSAITSLYKIELTDFADAAGGAFPPSAIIEIWSGCGGVNITNAEGLVLMMPDLTQGTEYFIRVYTNGTALHATFHISVTALTPPANDNCNTAATLTPVTDCAPGDGEGPFTTEGATKSDQPSGDVSGRDDDVWFKFTTGTANLYGKVTLANPEYLNFGHGVIELWANCGDAANTKFFPLTNTATLGTLLPNTTYYIRVYTYGLNAWIHSFKICVSLTKAPPYNDTYFTAATFALNPGTTCDLAVTGGTTAAATPENPFDCGGTYQPNDVWYRFTATGATAKIQLTDVVVLPGSATTNAKMWLQVFDGSNTAPVKLCSNTGKLQFDAHDAASTLIGGHTYYVRVYNDDQGNACSFNICTQVPPPPTYDECSRAVRLTFSTGETCDRGVQLTNLNATPSSGDASCIGQVGNDIWLHYSGAIHNMQLSINDYVAVKGAANPLMAIVVYSGVCGALTSVSCTLGKVATLPEQPAGEFYVRIISFDGGNMGNFTVCMHSLPAVPTNVDCAHATNLHVSTDASAEFIHGTTLGTEINNELTDCGGNKFVFSNAVWFKFTAAATTQLIDIQNITPLNGGTAQLGYKFYVGATCGTSSFACAANVANENNTLSGLVVGATYLVQVLLNHYNGDHASFDIRVIGATPPPNDEKANAVTLIQQPFYKASLATQGTFRFSTVSAVPAPGATYGGDVWYKFKAASSTATVKVNFGGANTRIEVNGTMPPVLYYMGDEGTETQLTGLLAGNTYTIRVGNPATVNATTAGSVFGITVFGLPSQDVADANTTGVNCHTADGPVHSDNSNRWLHITDNGKMVASIFDGHTGQATGLGNIAASYYVNQGGIRSTASFGAYLDRNYGVIPEREPILGNLVNVIFYFSKAEFDRLVAANPGINYLNDIGLAAFNELACANALAGNNRAEFSIIDYGALNSDVYYFEVALPHLSTFFLEKFHGGLLPVTCIDFTSRVKETEVQLNWRTATETNSSHFDVQRSTNALDFTTITSIDAAGTSSTPRYYSYVDNTSKTGGVYYYRLKQFDKDGRFTYICKTLKVATGSAANNLFGKAYPNPAVSSITVNIQKPYAGKVTVQVINVMGQVLSQKNMEINSTTGQVSVPTANLPAGAYTLRLVTKEVVYTTQFSKVQ